MGESAQEHLLQHLRDAHAVEIQALRYLERAAQHSDDDETKTVYTEHLDQTREHEKTVKELIDAHDHTPSPLEDKTLRAGPIGLRQLADIPLNTPVNMAMSLFALEHLEIATYELLGEIARRTDDEKTAEAANRIVEQEREAAEKIAGTFDRAAEALSQDGRETSSEEDADDGEHAAVLSHLVDVHALEEQSLQMLQSAAEELCEDEELKQLYREHLEQTREHESLVNDRIEGHDAKPSAVRDLHHGAASTGLRDLAAGPPDTTVKLAMNLFCVEHLEVAAYECMVRIAKQAGDSETADTAERILGQEKEAAEKLEGSFGRAVEVMLDSEAEYDRTAAAERPKQSEGEGREESSPSAS